MPSRTKIAQEAFEKGDVEASKKIHEHKEEGPQEGQYLGEFVYGAVDGTVTTFAVVAGATGASLDFVIVIILGFANLLADGFSMACGNFLSEKTQVQYIAKERKREEWEIKNTPQGEIEEVRQIYKRKGFKGKDLERAVQIITSNKKVWVDTMMTDELGLIDSNKSPWKTAAYTYIGFIIIGTIPLLAYVVSYMFGAFRADTFYIAIFMT